MYQGYIRSLDPRVSHEAIVRLDALYEFPWELSRALEVALFRTFAVPSIGGLLARTREFEQRPQRRYDDTGILLGLLYQYGYSHPRGAAALRRMNRIHARFNIANHDYLYVLSTFVCEPKRWIDRFGWRPMLAEELEAHFLFWREIGRRMGLSDLPPTFHEMRAFNEAFEAQHLRFSRGGRRVGEHARDLLLRWYLPRRLGPVLAPWMYAALDRPLLDAFGFEDPGEFRRALVKTFLKGRARAQRRLRQTAWHLDVPKRIEDLAWRSYPRGYELDDVGADRLPPHRQTSVGARMSCRSDAEPS